jgi:aldehyde dehydrogenase (NAD+)
MIDSYRMLIGGEFADAADDSTFPSIDPSTGEVFAEVTNAGPEDARRAVRAARDAFDAGPWPRMKGRDRAKVLTAVSDLVKQRSKELVDLEVHDAGHTIRTAKGGDLGMVISTFRVFAEIAGREDDERPLPRNPGSTNWMRREPIGVCAAITPWNFPMQMAAWKIAPAIAAGNTVVIKPSPYAPLSTLAIGGLCLEAGVPPGVVNVVAGEAIATGEALVSDPMVDKVAFTGSTQTGRRVMEMASANLTKVTLELGGKSAAVVLEDAPLDYVADGALWGVFFHAGQVCSAGTRLLVQRRIYDDLVAELVKRVEAFVVGPAEEPRTDVGPIINAVQLERIQRYVGIGRDEGAELATGGERAVVEGHDGGFYFRPTIFTGVRPDMRIAREEIFGQVLAVMAFDDEEQAVTMANDSAYGLAGGVWSADTGRAVKVAERLRTGTVWINDWHMINPRYPFGGYRQSGIGREHGELGYDEYREVKHIHVDLGGPSRERHPWWDITVPKRGDPGVPAADEPGSKPAG